MPGVKGSGGPPPKRESQRRRANKPEVPVVHAPAGEVKVPEPGEDWHPIAVRFFESLRKSGQSVFYESGDWQAAWVLCESMSREFKPQPLVVGGGKDARVEMVELPPKAASLAAWAKIMSGLLVTEGDRRRVRLELDRGDGAEESADVSELDDFRRRLSG